MLKTFNTEEIPPPASYEPITSAGGSLRVVFDLETTGLGVVGNNAEIVQLVAEGLGKSFSIYVLPIGTMYRSASDATSRTIEVISGRWSRQSL